MTSTIQRDVVDQKETEEPEELFIYEYTRHRRKNDPIGLVATCDRVGTEER